ncbi:MAG: hypothetical protein RL328_684 [Acidobacteriota bacterium]
MRTILYRRWAPAASPVKIEFPSDVLHEIRAQRHSDHDRGYLFGRRQGSEVRVLAAIRAPQKDDARLQWMEPLGIYVSRVRGEIFLTDGDLEMLQRFPEGIALVLAGTRGGFFPREADGSIQAVRSHEEFLIAEAAPQPEAPQALSVPSMARWLRHPAIPPLRPWQWVLTAAATLALPVGAATFLQPRIERPHLDLSMREANGQLVMSWDPQALDAGGRLEIDDGQERTVIALAAYVSGVTYEARSGDVDVRLTTPTHSGVVRWKSGRGSR